jgi:hypothetical protein
MAVGFPAKTNFATGDVLTATNMNDVTGTLNLLESAQYAAGKNRVINGDFGVWQRGTSISVPSAFSTYAADRFQVFNSGANEALTVARQPTNDTTNLPFIQYCTRFQRDSGQTGTTLTQYGQTLESVNSIPFAGKTITFSFYARKGANFSALSNTLAYSVTSGTGTDQNLFSGFTGATNVIAQPATLTTTWQRFTYSGTVASNVTQLGFQVAYTPTGTAGANDYFEITGIQLEAGSVASPFQTASGTLGGELALCQRYYFRAGANSGGTTNAYSPYGSGYTASTTEAYALVKFPQTMRTAPTAVTFGNLAISDSAGNFYPVGSILFSGANTNGATIYCYGLTSVVANRPAVLLNNNNTAGFFDASAEL